MSTVPALHAALNVIDDLMFDHRVSVLSTGLPRAIDIALMPPSPGGSPTSITERAGDYKAAAEACDRAAVDLTSVAAGSLPAAWRGAAAETAAEAVRALASQSGLAHVAFKGGADALNAFAEQLAQAQKLDEQGIELLRQVRDAALSPDESGIKWFEIRDQAALGCRQRLVAANIRDHAATDVVSALNQIAAEARARQINSPGIDPLSSIALSYADDGGFARSDLLDNILTPTALARGSQLLNNMSQADRKKFDEMLGGAKSPQEAAYIWKALAAGYSLADVQAFDELIHPHGNDFDWLFDHLNPHVNSPDISGEVEEGGEHALRYEPGSTTPAGEKDGVDVDKIFGQDKGDCVSAATIIARAANDPVFMLGLTTGQGPAASVVGGADPGNDSRAAFRDRLVHVYDATDAKHPGGKDAEKLFTTMLQPVTGDAYTETHVAGASPSEMSAAREAMLPEIETAVNAGKPVPITVSPASGKGVAHELVIMAVQDDMLEIYNPWGFTEWVSKQQFIHGVLGSVTGNDDHPSQGLSNPTDVAVPR
ncbi:hypothetical protein [Nocardia sp. NPDC004260]